MGFHPSNAMTYLSLLCAVGAIAGAVHGSAAMASALIAAAVIADTLDGRFARLFARTAEQRAIGTQLDSLSDAIAFGAAPCVCIAALAQRDTPMIGPGWWLAFAAFSTCAITRLAFYNVTHETTDGFVGLPVPVAALLWSSLVLIDPGLAAWPGVLVTIAAAMVLPVPVPRPRGAGLVVFVAWPASVIAAHLLM
jgi:CDP-diacylglycerol--serine O-phosphatidyltransferase